MHWTPKKQVSRLGSKVIIFIVQIEPMLVYAHPLYTESVRNEIMTTTVCNEIIQRMRQKESDQNDG